MDYGGYDSHSSGGVEVGPKLYLNLVASLLGQVRFWRLEVLEGSINVSRFHDWWTGRQRVVGGEVDLRKTPVVLWDAERKLGHRKSTKTGVSIDDHQARIDLERWRPG